jgi:hypothetical protein
MRKRRIAATLLLLAGLSVAAAAPTPLHQPTAAHACSPAVSWPGYGPYLYTSSSGTNYIAADFNYSCFSGSQQIQVIYCNQSNGACYVHNSPIFSGNGPYTDYKDYVTRGVTWNVHACILQGGATGGNGSCTSTLTITTT